MIKPIQSPVSFLGNGMKDYISQTSKASVNKDTDVIFATAPTKAEKMPDENKGNITENTATKEKVSLKTRFLNLLKGINNIKGTTAGFVRGVVDGVVVAGGIGFIGKNIKKANGNIFKTVGGMIKDTGKAVAHVVTKSIPNIIMKSPFENAKSVLTAPVKFYKNYLKGNKATGAIATVGLIGMVAFRTIQGKMIANKNNAEIDHYTHTKH